MDKSISTFEPIGFIFTDKEIQTLLNYLQGKPFREVNELIQMIINKTLPQIQKANDNTGEN